MFDLLRIVKLLQFLFLFHSTHPKTAERKNFNQESFGVGSNKKQEIIICLDARFTTLHSFLGREKYKKLIVVVRSHERQRWSSKTLQLCELN